MKHTQIGVEYYEDGGYKFFCPYCPFTTKPKFDSVFDAMDHIETKHDWAVTSPLGPLKGGDGSDADE